jgi:hypothetical protein
MAAGLGFKDFTTGEVLTAADVDGYLMQGVWVFASAAARDAAVTSPQEGNFAFLKDTNVTTYYTGSAWANLDTTGMTNPMTTTGDTIYSSSGSTPARLGIGTAGQVLQVNSGATAPEWAAPITGGMTEIGTIDFATATSFTSIPATYVNLFVVVKGFGTTTANNPRVRFNSDSGSNYSRTGIYGNASTNGSESSIDVNQINLSFQAGVTTTASNAFAMTIFDYKNSTTQKVWSFNEKFNGGGTNYFGFFQGYYKSTTAISSIEFSAQAGTLEGTATLYGVK